MNLFELAHHPKAWDRHDTCRCKDIDCAWWDAENSTSEQMKFLAPLHDFESLGVSCHIDENEFRMHLLFVHWATEGAS